MVSLPTERAARSCIAAVVSCTAIACYWPLLDPSECRWPFSPYCDYESFQLPVRAFIGRALRCGILPLWNPHLGLGMPIVSRQQSGLCDPLMTPLLLVVDAHSAICLGLFGHLLLMAWGQWRLARHLELDSASSSVAVCLVLHNGFMHGHMLAGHVSVLFAVSMIPLVLLKALDLAEGRTSLPAGLAVWLSLMFLTGHPQTLYYSLLIAPPLAWCLARRSIRCQPVGYVVRWIFAAGCGAGLSAVQLIPAAFLAIECREFSPRGSAEFSRGLGLRPVDFFSFLIEWPTGSPWFSPPELDGQSFPHERSIWMGAAASGWLLLIYLRLVRVNRRQRVLAAFVVVALVAAGVHATRLIPLLSALPDLLPGWNLFRCHGRIQSVLAPLWALLVGGVVSNVRAGFTRSRDRAMLIDPGGSLLRLAGLLAVIAMVADPSFGSVWKSVIQQSLLSGDLAWAAGLVLLGVLLPAAIGIPVVSRGNKMGVSDWSGGRNRMRTSGRRWVVAACVTAALVTDPLRMGMKTMARFRGPARQQLVELPPGVRFLQADRFPVVDLDELRYGRLVSAAMTGDRSMPGTNEGGTIPVGTERILRAVVKNPVVAAQVLGCQWILDGDGSPKWQVERGLPVIRFVDESNLDGELLQRPLKQLTSDDLRQLRRQLVQPRVVWIERSPNRLVIDVDLPQPSTLVVAECFATSWCSFVNGEATDIESAHGCLRRVKLNAGRVRVELQYFPLREMWGLWISLATAAVMVLLMHQRRRSVDSHPGADR